MQQRCETDADKLGKNNAHNGVGAIQWNYDRAEIIADGVVHALGISINAAHFDRVHNAHSSRRCCGLRSVLAYDAGVVGGL